MIVASELVENAVVHARTGGRLAIRLDDRGLTIAVRDSGPFTELHPRPGHGLFMVAEVSQAWAVSPTEEGKSVWALLPIAGCASIGDYRSTASAPDLQAKRKDIGPGPR